MFDFLWPSWARDLLFVLLAFLGGVLGHITRRFESGHQVKLSLALVKGAGSAFTGALMLFVCKYLNLSFEATGICVGLFGWLGAEATISMLQRFVYSKMGIDGGSDVASDEKSVSE